MQCTMKKPVNIHRYLQNLRLKKIESISADKNIALQPNLKLRKFLSELLYRNIILFNFSFIQFDRVANDTERRASFYELNSACAISKPWGYRTMLHSLGTSVDFQQYIRNNHSPVRRKTCN